MALCGTKNGSSMASQNFLSTFIFKSVYILTNKISKSCFFHFWFPKDPFSGQFLTPPPLFFFS